MKIQVIDVCDNVPYFVNRLHMVRVSENTRPGTVIMKVTAEDMDEGKVIYIKIFCVFYMFVCRSCGHLRIRNHVLRLSH